MVVTNADLKDVELVYYDCIFTLKAGDSIDLPFEDLTIEQIMEMCLLNIHSSGSWSVTSYNDEIEIRSIDFDVMGDHEDKFFEI